MDAQGSSNTPENPSENFQTDEDFRDFDQKMANGQSDAERGNGEIDERFKSEFCDFLSFHKTALTSHTYIAHFGLRSVITTSALENIPKSSYHLAATFVFKKICIENGAFQMDAVLVVYMFGMSSAMFHSFRILQLGFLLELQDRNK